MPVKRRVVVVGGGAAGMMAACTAAEAGAEVCLVEKNEKLGKKLFITGKGRCNLTNSCADGDFFSHVVNNPRFLYSALSALDPAALCAFFEERGLKLKEERGGRIFPASDHSSDVIRCLERTLKADGVRILLNTEVNAIVLPEAEGGTFGLRIDKEGGGEESLEADALIVATGGASYPATGSDGRFFAKLKQLGHGCTELKPALVPLVVREEEECRELMGLTLKNVSLSLMQGKKSLYEGFGELLYTHFGLSGPLILSASSAWQKRKDGAECILRIDLKPALDEKTLDERLLREFDANKNKKLSNVMPALLPGKLAAAFPKRCGLDGDMPVHSITKDQRRQILETLKGLRYTVTGCRGFEEAIITRGGVPVKEVDPSTMGSKLVKGLYLAGELLDVDAHTGGYNLQIAWSTGYLAGRNAAGG